MLEDIIYQLISENINCKFLEVTGDGRHFDATIVSNIFENKSRINRHRLVYQALGDKMQDEVHALSMKVYTTTEWEALARGKI